MKRRIFLSAASTIGIAGAVSSASVVSSAYTSVSTSILLEEFTSPTRNVLDKFQADVSQNIKGLRIDAKYVKNVTTPVQIMSKESKGNRQHITFKNKAGDYVSLSVTDGVEKISILKDFN